MDWLRMIHAVSRFRLIECWSCWELVRSHAKNSSTLLLFLTLTPIVVSADVGQEDWRRCKSGDPQQSIAGCSALIQSGKLTGRELAIAFYSRGRTYRLKGDAVHAIEDYNHALQIDPFFMEAFYGRGLAFRSSGQYDRAIQDFDEVLRIDPKYVDALTARGSTYSRKGEYGRAIQDYDEALNLDPSSADALYNRARAQGLAGNYDRAIGDYTRALELTPHDADTFWGRAWPYSKKGDYERAIADYNQALQLQPNADLYHDRGIAYLRRGDYFAAIKDGFTFRWLKYRLAIIIVLLAFVSVVALLMFAKRTKVLGNASVDLPQF